MEVATHGERPRRLVPAVDRAARVLAALRAAGRPCTLTELASLMAVNKATVLDILLTLAHHGLVQRDPETKRFRLGPALAAYAAEGTRPPSLRAAARPVLRVLAEQTGETAALGVVQAGRLRFLDSEAAGDFALAVPVGRELPLIATSLGKLLCAYLTEEELASALADSSSRFTPRSAADPATFRRQLAAVRRQGYALDLGEYSEGVYGLAAPTWGPSGGVVAGIAVVGLLGRLTDARREVVREAVVGAARTLSERLGDEPTRPSRADDGNGVGVALVEV